MASGRLSKVKGKVVDIPTVPTVGTATAGTESASVAFTASTIGGPVSTYTALSNPGSVTGSGTSSPVTVSGLTAGTAYTFTVRGNNVTGSSEYSSASNSITALAGSSYESIASASGTGSSGTISFTSIPQTFTHLQIRGIAKPTTVDGVIWFGYNGVTDATQYNTHVVIGDGSAATSFYEGNQHYIYYFSNNVATGDIYGTGIIDILDYKNTNKFKVARAFTATDKNGSGAVLMTSHLYRSTNAITQIDLRLNQGNFTTGTRIALYGIRGS